MSTDSNAPETRKSPKDGERSMWPVIKDVTSAAGAIAAIIFGTVAAIAAHDATVSANNAQAIFQGGDACRAIRTEILDLHQAGLNSMQITKVLKEEQASPEYRTEHAGQKVDALDEDNTNCGTKTGKNGTVQDWIKTISAA